MNKHENISYFDFLKFLVKRTEERIASWKTLLTDCYKNNYAESEWFKEMLRDYKNIDEKRLKGLREELTNFNQGLNPPYCYIVRNKA